MSQSLVDSTKEYILSAVLGRDPVPRLAEHHLARLLTDIPKSTTLAKIRDTFRQAAEESPEPDDTTQHLLAPGMIFHLDDDDTQSASEVALFAVVSGEDYDRLPLSWTFMGYHIPQRYLGAMHSIISQLDEGEADSSWDVRFQHLRPLDFCSDDEEDEP